MQFKKGVKVIDAMGDHVGDVDRVVIDPRDGTVREIVVRKGLIFNEDKVLPLDQVERTSDDAVVLNITKDKLKDLPDFVDTHYVPLDQNERARTGYTAGGPDPLYWYPATGFGVVGGGPGMWGTYPPPVVYPYKIEEDVNIPPGTVPLKEGAKVIGNDGQAVGTVEKVLTENKENRITGLVITKGALTKERRIIPAHWIDSVKDDGVKLAVTSQFVEKLETVKE